MGRLGGLVLALGICLIASGWAIIGRSYNSFQRREAMYDERSRRESTLAILAAVIFGVILGLAGIILVFLVVWPLLPQR